MAWPPPILSTTRDNLDPQWDSHPADHNRVSLAVRDISNYMINRVALEDGYTPTTKSCPNGWNLLPITSRETPAYGEDIHMDFTSDGILADETPGLHLLVGMCQWAANSTGRRILGVSTSPTTSPHADNYRTQRAPSTGLFVQQVTIPLRITVIPQTLYLWCYQDTGAALTVNTCSLAVVRLLPF